MCDAPAGQQDVVGGHRVGSGRVVLDVGRQRRRLYDVVLEVARQGEERSEERDADDVASDLLALTAQGRAVRTTEASVALHSDQHRHVDGQSLDKQCRRVDVLAEYRNDRVDPRHLQQESLNGRQSMTFRGKGNLKNGWNFKIVTKIEQPKKK